MKLNRKLAAQSLVVGLSAMLNGGITVGHAAAQPNCGTVRLPYTDAYRVLTVTSGTVECDEAGSVINRYISDPALLRTGNTQAAEFMGWLCVTPTATAAEIDGYSMICNRGRDELQVEY